MNNKVTIVGAGIFGCTLARILAERNINVWLIDKRTYIGGNCFSYNVDGIEVHQFGSHIFHTDKKDVWDFVNRFASFNNYQHHVVAEHKNKHYFLPFNLMLLEQFFNKKFNSPEAAENYLKKLIEEDVYECGIDPKNPKNLEEQAITLIGADLYEAFVESYTEKQWNCKPKFLDASIIKRLPVRYNYNINYFNDPWQGIPINGYSKMLENMVCHTNIIKAVGHAYDKDWLEKDVERGDTVVYTGPIDELFGYEFGTLTWRSLEFHDEYVSTKDFQGNACVNYVDSNKKYTRIHEFKHYHPENSEMMNASHTCIQYEYPVDWSVGKERFYPINNSSNIELYNKYVENANKIYGNKLIFGGRLGLYKYFDMDDAIYAAMECAKNISIM